MTPEDAQRELNKVHAALTWACRHHEKRDESNAALHMSEKVQYAPLTGTLQRAATSVERLMSALHDGSLELPQDLLRSVPKAPDQ